MDGGSLPPPKDPPREEDIERAAARDMKAYARVKKQESRVRSRERERAAWIAERSSVITMSGQAVLFGAVLGALLSGVTGTGAEKWHFTTGAGVRSSPALSRDDATVFVGSKDNKLACHRPCACTSD